MRPTVAGLIAVVLVLFGAGGGSAAGGIHIRYGPDAPEKMEESNIRYYEGVVQLEHKHPLEFEHEHPFYAKMFHDPVMLDKLVARWEAHPQRFEYWHNCLWKVLDGYVATHPSLPAQLGPSPIEVGPGGVSYRVPPGGGGVTPSSVPEPSSGLMIVLALLTVGSWLAYRRARTPFHRSPAAS